MTKELQKEYMDEAGNIQFNNQYLDEIEKDEEQSEKGETDLTIILEKLIESTQKKEDEKNLKHIAEKFIIEKFTSKNANAKQWLEIFEKECTRFNINKDETKIEALRLLLDESCLNWYKAMMMKEVVKREWLEWKEKFLDTFADKGWNRITYAHLFKYKEGSLIDYVMKKERLLLEVNKSIDPITLIHIIAVGLPEFIRSKIDRDSLKNSIDLFNEIKKHEGIVYKKNYTRTKDGKPDVKRKNEEKKPCKTCESLNKGLRYHPEEKCWFKTTETKKEKSNSSSIVGNNSVIEVDLNTEKKNE